MLRNRLVCYLDAVGCSPIESLQISLQVIETVRQQCETDDTADPFKMAFNDARQRLKSIGRIEGGNCLLSIDKDIIQPPKPEHKPGIMAPKDLDMKQGQNTSSLVFKMTKLTIHSFLSRIHLK